MLKLVLIFIISLTSLNSLARPIRIGSKSFTESYLIAEMAALLLEQQQIEVERKYGLGGTKVAFDALKIGDIDLYPEYTGTGYTMILKKSGETNPNKVFSIITKEFNELFDMKWSNSLGFNNTYAIAVSNDNPKFEKITKVSQLKPFSFNLRYAAPYEFMERKDGHEGFTRHYALSFDADKTISMQAGLMYQAIKEKKVDLIVVYSTDGRIKANNLKILEDDQNFFPPYMASYLVRSQSLKKFPKIVEVFETLESKLNEKDMIRLNDLVDRLKKSPEIVAKNFLISKNLLKGKITKENNNQGFFNFLISKKSYLFQLTKEHLTLSFISLILGILISLPIGIFMARKKIFADVIFPIINTIQTIPSMALLGFMVPIVGIGSIPALIALFLYSLLPIVRSTYLGIKNVDKSYVEASKGIGLTGQQILFKVELPLALPIILGGIRTAAVVIIGTATIAALIGAGGLGDPIFRGVSTVNSNLILLGAIPSALLAIIIDKLIQFLESKIISKGLRLQRKS